MKININGRDQDIDSDPETPLLYVLRGELGLNGPKFGCGLHQCGACTVMVDGEAHFSCRRPVSEFEGKRIVTVEGLGTIDKPGAMQRAFMEEQAAQCGYCIPGMMMRAQALLQKNLNASDADIREALDHNLCRCGTHMRILRAVQRAAGLMRTSGNQTTGGAR